MATLRGLAVLFLISSLLGSVFTSPADQPSENAAPRISDVLEYLEANGGVTWTSTNGTRYTTHTYEEWAAAESALMGNGAMTFVGLLASETNSSSVSQSSKSLSTSPSPAPILEIKRDSWGQRITGGISFNGVNRYAYSYCYNSGQWGSTGAFSDFVLRACTAIMNHGQPDRVITWHSQGYHQPDHNVAAWFVQQSGKGGLSIHACQEIFSGFKDGGVPTGSDPWCTGTGKLGKKDGPGMTQGGYVRWYDNKDNSWTVGSQAGQLKIDPNKCFSSGKPCSNYLNVATIQSSRLRQRQVV
ncbi:MAG: hypothetical protein Q9227_008378 [Pyrenula ochraceoflavens]